MQSLFGSLKAFLKEPFTTPMSFWQYAALVGFTIVLVVLWMFILQEIERGVKEI
jgi:hypothetical protein